MEYNPKVHHRRSIRLTHYDYSLPEAYFVTICAFGKRCVFGSVVGDRMREKACGRIVREQWLDTVRIRPQIELDAFTVMPNHLHGILWILGLKGEHILTQEHWLRDTGRRRAEEPSAHCGARHRWGWAERCSALP
jgi:REP element-mobilizing transposase RayT